MWVDKQIDTTEYNVSDGYKSVCYSNHELKTESEKLHGTVSFLDGSQITLPVSKEDMEKSGWELSGEERCDPMGVAVEEYCNKKGQSVFMYPGEEGKYGKLRISRHNAFAGTKPADFLIAEKIALKSSAKEVIEVLGNPMRIMYSEAIKDKQATVCFTYSTGKCVFDVTFSIKENRIIDVSFLNSN